MPKLEITNNPATTDNDFIIQKTREYNSTFVPSEFEELSVFCRSVNDDIIGGLTGKTFWGWLHIEYLWVEEAQRGKNIGTDIVLAAESEAKKRGCVGSTLDTFSFQALGFYQKLGYSQVGKLSGYRDKYDRFYLQKKLN